MNEERYSENYNEVDLLQLISTLWRGKWIILVTSIFSVYLGFQYLINQPKFYTTKAIFGFQGENKHLMSPELSLIGNFTGTNKNNEILTQINGGNFLRSIVIDLNLLEKPEFSNFFISEASYSFFSFQSLKNLLKDLLKIETKSITLTDSKKIKLIVKR